MLRRTVFFLLGGVLALPYLVSAGLLAQLFVTDPGSRAGIAATAVVVAVIGVLPPFLSGTRELEIAAARALLGVDLPGSGRVELETRLRSALWFALHLVTGGLVGAVLLIALPVALLAITERLGLTSGAIGGVDLHPSWVWAPVGILVTVAVVAGLGRLAGTMAPVLLGPSVAERLAEVREAERRLAERNRLARELHDAVGHALTAMTLQAGGARAVFDADPGFARRALAAIEDTGRSAATELDTVLGILRDSPATRRPAPTLDDLDQLLTAGVRADVHPFDVPAAVSREAYRIVQESLTNAARHGCGEVTLHIRQEGDLMIEVTNRTAAPPARTGGGHGVEGMRERVRLLGGTLTAGPDGGRWRVAARLPVAAP
ncbi:sensor histidine kinase [Actinoplanes utahensis]|uniref:histidine kinase n=1 Tax=Actinoplanes utahensis TaxID=1869 RepID=A0A0A6UHL1_ACTUT|nr:histidine kinase [Actinoplanes utahensis]KHD74588.1 hypothetical protein MB27_27695 [Actinoplanes utahensis]GIF27686.1 histidine kinase [Actinoplanes utahensis]